MGKGFDCAQLNFTEAATDRVTDDAGRDTSWAGLRSTAVLYSVLALGLVGLFEVSRGKRSVYGRRLRSLRHRTPQAPARWPLQWLHPVLTLSDDEVKH
jgi:hypothetical protein